jgi:squalene-hopene/tetraprenyl-beta-curcumene cyclase
VFDEAKTRGKTEADPLTAAVSSAAAALRACQQEDGHWIFDLEADVTIPAEFVLYLHYLDERDPPLEAKIGVYLRARQADHGGWPLFFGGDFNISASVKAYYALKAIGDAIDAPHMQAARRAILAHGGAATSNVFTRTLLALFGQLPWRAVPVMPVEIMLLPKWFFFHLDKVSYWSRTVIVPLLVLNAVKPRARNPRMIDISELFVVPPGQLRNWNIEPARSHWTYLFRAIDSVLQRVEPWAPSKARQRAIGKAVEWVDQRLNGEDGLGAIFPAMVNAVLMYDALGIGAGDPRVVIAKRAIRKLVVEGEEQAWVQPCVSPVWDTALACHALLEAGDPDSCAAARRAADWLAERQVCDVVGDWAEQRPGLAPGGWAFQYANPHYPDVDDTAVVLAAMGRLDPDRYRPALEKGSVWLRGMQCANGGWGAFDAENTHDALNHIPFADHGALLDPPTADVSARCVSVLAAMAPAGADSVLQRGIDYLLAAQEADGSWFGRWGTNYIYGTWSALAALNAAGLPHSDDRFRKAVEWLLARQRADGGWGEDGRSYWDHQPHGEGGESTPSQTAWALLGLMAAGEAEHPAVSRGIAYLLGSRNQEGLWDEDHFTAVGFPRIFYLRYHGYRAFFPLWALARYRSLQAGNFGPVLHAL